MGTPSLLRRINRDFINFSDRRGVLGLALILTDSVFQSLLLYLLWTEIVIREFYWSRSTVLPRQSFFMTDMHFATFNFYLCIYTIVTIVPQIYSALLYQTRDANGPTYFILKSMIGMLGLLNLHVPCLVFTALGSQFRPVADKKIQKQWTFARNIALIFMSIPMITNLLLIEYSGHNVLKLVIFFAFT